MIIEFLTPLYLHYGLNTIYLISRRILKMNKRLVKEFEEYIAEKGGWNWPLTSIAINAWGETEEMED